MSSLAFDISGTIYVVQFASVLLPVFVMSVIEESVVINSMSRLILVPSLLRKVFWLIS